MSIKLRVAGKYSNTEAQEILTLGEMNAIQRHFGREVSNEPNEGLYGTEFNAGLVWALERRAALEAGEKLVSWDEVSDIPLGELNKYFLPEEPEVLADEPESESGKDDSLDA